MKVSEVKKRLLESLVPMSNEYNFKVVKGKFALIAKENNKFSSLYFVENHWSDEIQIIPFIEVGIKEIDDIVKKFNKYHSRTYSMNLRRLYYWYEDKYWNDFEPNDKDKYRILNYDNDITDALNNIQELFKNYGIRYINEYGNLKGVDKLYNTNPKEEDNIHCPGFQVHCIVGLIAAKLSNNPRYNDIEEIYTNRINKHKEEDSMDQEDIERFFKIKEYLKSDVLVG